MHKKRSNESANLGEVLLAAHKQQQSGLLRVEHIWEGRVEKGALYILMGQPVYARVEGINGQEALERMLTWHAIRFFLVPDAPRPPANLSAGLHLSFFIVPPEVPASPMKPPAARPGRPAELIPRKNKIESTGVLSLLTRPQRMIYFLIDGQRTIEILALCSNKDLAEAESIVLELQRLKLVTF